MGILHGCEKFRLYLLETKFRVLTGHKPLVELLNNPNAIIPLQIERWLLRLQAYDFEVSHTQGHFNPTDYYSRHTNVNVESVVGRITEEHVNFVIASATPAAIPFP